MGEEKPRLRGVSHHLAALVTLPAGGVLVSAAASARAAMAGAVYALSLATMFAVSATYHRVGWRPAARAVWRRLDHSAIFVVIAGTYTPICLVGIGGDAGWSLLLLVWGGAALGILQATLWSHAPRAVAVVLYCLLGWVAVAYVDEVRAALSPAALALMAAGGVLYTAGAVIYALRRPDPFPRVFGFHEVFHALVIAASACHFAVIVEVVRGAH